MRTRETARRRGFESADGRDETRMKRADGGGGDCEEEDAGDTNPYAATPSPESLADDILSWAEVNRTHRIRNGVYQRRGRLISLLTDFGRINPCYPDVLANDSGDRIFYTGEGRHGDQHLSPGNRAMLAAIDSGHAVPLFNKLAVGRWQHMGFWRVAEAAHRFDHHENRMLWQFTLELVNRES